MSGREVGKALLKLSPDGINEMVSTLPPGVIAILHESSAQDKDDTGNSNELLEFEFGRREWACRVLWVTLPVFCAGSTLKGFLLMVPVQIHQFTSQQSLTFFSSSCGEPASCFHGCCGRYYRLSNTTMANGWREEGEGPG